MKYDTEVFKLSDGGKIHINYKHNTFGKIHESSNPLVILLPGFISKVVDHYHITLIEQFEMKGYDWALVNFRGTRGASPPGLPTRSKTEGKKLWPKRQISGHCPRSRLVSQLLL